jgi:hypothetical protein
MSAEPKRSIERAAAALDSVIESLIEMKPAALRRAPARLTEAVNALTGILQGALSPNEQAAIASAARTLRGRIHTAWVLLAGAQRLCGPAADCFGGYTAEGEHERFEPRGTLSFEL